MEFFWQTQGPKGLSFKKTPLQTTPKKHPKLSDLLKVRVKLSDFTTSVLDFTSFTRLRNFQAAFKGRVVKLDVVLGTGLLGISMVSGL